MANKKSIISSLFWKFMESTGTQGVRFFLSIILARLLAPSDYGAVALVMIVIVLAEVFVQSGLNTALIRKKDADDLDFSSVFWASIAIAFVLYIAIFFTAPAIACFYNNNLLTPVIRVLSLTLFIGVFNSVQYAYISRNMLFKKLFYRSMAAIIPSGILGIALAYMGMGVWALVYQQLANALFSVIAMWVTVPWRPQIKFSFKRLKSMFSFGWKLLMSSIIDKAYGKMRALVIGKMFSAADLAFYDRGDHLPYLLVNNINNSITSVMLPSLSAYQNDKVQLKKLMRRSIVTSSFFIVPIMAGVAATAHSIILMLLGEKWLPCVPFMLACCLMYALYPIQTVNLTAINAIGRSDIFLKLEIIKKIYGMIILIASYFYFKSAIGIAYGSIASSIISSFVNAQPNAKLMEYGYLEQIKDLAPSFILSAIMCIAIYFVGVLPTPIYITFAMQVVLGALIYFGIAKMLHLECLNYIVNTIKEFKEKHGRK